MWRGTDRFPILAGHYEPDVNLDLNWRCPFNDISPVFSFCQVPSLCEDLLSSVDQPLKIARDKVVGKDYLLCDYNRDGDSYR